jgi:hypothetical protein
MFGIASFIASILAIHELEAALIAISKRKMLFVYHTWMLQMFM